MRGGRESEKSRRCQIFTSTCSPFFPPRRGLASSGRYAGPYEPRVGVPYRPGNLFSLLSLPPPSRPPHSPSAAPGHSAASGGSDGNEKLGRCRDFASFGTPSPPVHLPTPMLRAPTFSSTPFIYRTPTRTYGVFVKHAAGFPHRVWSSERKFLGAYVRKRFVKGFQRTFLSNSYCDLRFLINT